jgi:hypothetical protein
MAAKGLLNGQQERPYDIYNINMQGNTLESYPADTLNYDNFGNGK